MATQQRKLFRSNSNRVFAGICGGFGEYMNIDTTIIRLVWILLTLLGGSGLFLYTPKLTDKYTKDVDTLLATKEKRNYGSVSSFLRY